MKVQHIQYPLNDTMLPIQPSILAIGTFDGVHLGHQEVIRRARQLGERQGCATAVMTFEPHPREVLHTGHAPPLLTPLSEKLIQFENQQMDLAYVMRFDRQLAALSPKQFITDILFPLGVQGVVVGFNYTFGRQAAGKAEDLKRLSDGRLIVEIVPPIIKDGIHISSTRLRQFLRDGQIEQVNELLGRPYCLRGTVIRGAGRGKKLGFPTANIRLNDSYTIPQTGIYIVRVVIDDTRHFGLLSIGFNPTFEDDRQEPSIEVYILDVDENLYGRKVSLQLLHYLRPELKFDAVEELIEQMHQDEKNAREWIYMMEHTQNL